MLRLPCHLFRVQPKNFDFLSRHVSRAPTFTRGVCTFSSLLNSSPRSRSFSFARSSDSFFVSPFATGFRVLGTRQFCSALSQNHEKFVAARMLCAYGGNTNDLNCLYAVLSAAGIEIDSVELEKFWASPGEIELGLGRKRKGNHQILATKLAAKLCMLGGDEVPSVAAVHRVLHAAGVDVDHSVVSNVLDQMPTESPTPQLDASSSSSSSSSSSDSNVPEKKGRGALAVIATGALVLFGKTKYVLAALKLTKFSSLASMVVTSFAYSFVFGWPYAVGMVGLILVHESGHALTMRHFGYPFSPMVFIPFVGAMVQMNAHPKTAYEDAIIALGGPVLGSLAAGVVAVAGAMTGSQLLIALADFGFMINFFNLLPIGPLDGGKIAAALWRGFHVLGLGLGGFLIYSGYLHNPIFYLVMLFGAINTYHTFTNPPHPTFSSMTPAQRGVIAFGYFGLIAALLFGMALNNRNRRTPKQLREQQHHGHQLPTPRERVDFYDESHANEAFSELNWGTEEELERDRKERRRLT